MNRQANSRHQDLDQRRQIVLRPIAAAVAAMLFTSLAAYAQQTTPETDAEKKKAAEALEAKKKAAAKVEQLETIVVPGIRRGIESSIATKRDANSIVEVVSAEDIGKLPDVSIAESLSRLPGLAGQRVDGRVQEISIRGLGGDFAVVLLNGREQVSTGDNRGVQFDQYPSELITKATVYKTPDATLAAQGVAGAVNMVSIRPLDSKGQQVAVNVRGERNSNGVQMAGISDTGNRVSATYVNQFANNTVGFALGFAHLDSPLQAKKYRNFGWSVSAGNVQFMGLSGLTVDTANPPAISTGFEVGPQSSTQKRDGAMAVLEFRPNASFHSTVDVYYSKFNTREKNNLFQTFNFGRFGGLMSNLTQTGPGGILNSGVFSTASRLGVFNGGNTTGDVNSSVLRTQVNTRDDTLSAFGWNNEFKLGDWTAVGDLSASRATRHDVRLEAYSRIGVADTIGFNFPPNGDAFPSFNLSQSYTNPATLRLVEQFGRLGYSQRPDIKDDLKSVRLDAKRGLDWGIFNAFDAGVNFSKRDKSRDWNEDTYRLATPTTQIQLASDLLTANAPANYAGIPGFLGFDLAAAMNRYGTFAPLIDGNTFGRRWAVHEKISNAFVKMGIDAHLGSLPLRGNLGVQVVNADQKSDGFDQSTRANGTIFAVPVTRGATYQHVLPSLNLVAEVANDTYARFGAARSVARPRMDEMRAFNSAGLNRTIDQVTGAPIFTWSGSGGNPSLKPWVSDGLDISLEKYFAKGSYVSLAGFSKRLKTYIYNQVTTIDYTGYPNATGNVPSTNFGTFTRPENGTGGVVEGVELTVSLEGKLFTPWLDGFGVSASGSDTHSSIRRSGPNDTTQINGALAGLSGRATNLTLYYEKSGFSARVSERQRSPFTAEITGLFGFRSFVTYQSDTVVDTQLGYNFESGALKGLGVLLQINNATDAATRTFSRIGNVGTSRPEEYNTYGRQVLLGINYKL